MNQGSDLKNKDFSKSKAEAGKIRWLRLIPVGRKQVWNALQGLCQIFGLAEEWGNITSVQRILEKHGTDKLLEFLDLYNYHVFRSIHYHLCEKESEEEEEGFT